MTISPFAERLLHWFDQHGRHDLPWQHDQTPYRVWVSEIMLQQTQVSTVIPYYEKFMARFPDVQTLAAANQDEVLQYWAGLGYYARGRNLHKAAQVIVNDYAGEFPQDIDQVQQLPGIGRSTAGAILSLSRQQRHPILDGNVKRVLTRHQAMDGWPGQTAIEQQLWQLAEQRTPQQRVNDYTQAIMDLGATLCTRSKPACLLCPVQTDCEGFKQGKPTAFPVSKPKKTQPVKTTTMLLILNEANEILLEKRPPAGIWGGLWSLPECDGDAAQWVEQQFGLNVIEQESWTPFRHTFSHYHLDITPQILRLANTHTARVMEGRETNWYKADQANNIGCAAPVTKLLASLRQHLEGATS